MSEQTLIKQFNKNSMEIIKIQTQVWRDQVYVDCRIWYQENPAKLGAEKPTHKGLTISAALLDELISGLEEARDALELEGKEC